MGGQNYIHVIMQPLSKGAVRRTESPPRATRTYRASTRGGLRRGLGRPLRGCPCIRFENVCYYL